MLLISTFAEVALALWLLYRHGLKYRVLLSSLGFEIMTAPLTYYVLNHYGQRSVQYDIYFWRKIAASLLFSAAVAFANRGEKRIAVPFEAYSALLLVLLAAHWGLFGLIDFVNTARSFYYLGVLGWLAFVTRKPAQEVIHAT